MKKLAVVFLLCVFLCGCGAAETFETLGNVQHEPSEEPVMGTVCLSLPDTAKAEVFAVDGSTLYECDGYCLTVQTLASGDLLGTIETLSGFQSEKLTVMQTKTEKGKRYEWVWTAVGEGGDILCRATVLDDGSYSYCLCAMVAAENALLVQQEWNSVFSSFSIS